MKIRMVIVIMLFCVVIGFFSGFYFNKINTEEPVPIIEYIVDDSVAIKRLKIEEALVNGVEQEQKLIVMEVDLSENITIDASFTDWDIFKKAQKISISATGKYAANLGALSANDIIFDDSKNNVTLKLLRPEIDSITINEEQTAFYNVEKGLLRFGEIRLTTSEQNEIYAKAKESMMQKMKTDLLDDAYEYTKNSVTDLAKKFLTAAGIEECAIDVVWK